MLCGAPFSGSAHLLASLSIIARGRHMASGSRTAGRAKQLRDCDVRAIAPRANPRYVGFVNLAVQLPPLVIAQRREQDGDAVHGVRARLCQGERTAPTRGSSGGTMQSPEIDVHSRQSADEAQGE